MVVACLVMTIHSCSKKKTFVADHRVVANGPLADVMASPHPFLQGFFTATAQEHERSIE